MTKANRLKEEAFDNNKSEPAEAGEVQPDPTGTVPGNGQETMAEPDTEPEATAGAESNGDADADLPEPLLVGGIDLDSIALDDDYSESMEGDDAGVAAMPIRKPSRDWFVRTHSTNWKNVRVLEIKDGADRGFYLVARPLWKLCQAEDVQLRPIRLTLATSRESGPFLWPLKLQEKGCDNRRDDWSVSALRICKAAETQWVKVFTRQGGNCYSFKVADAIEVEPVWPVQSFKEIIALAFEGRVINDATDPLFRRLRGQE
jgi:hypothetical protein